MVGSFWAIAKVLMRTRYVVRERIATNIERIGNAVEPLEAGHDLLGFCDFEFERL